MTTISTALTDLLDPRLELTTAIDRHFAPTYRQRTDGVWNDRDEFAEHVAHLRVVVTLDRVEVLEELQARSQYAERHVVRLTKRGGGRIVQEVYVFGDRASDGRFARIEETTLMLAGSADDRGIAGAR